MIYHHISLVEEYLLCYGMYKKYTHQRWHGEGDLNKVVRNDDDIEDDSDTTKPIEHGGIGSLLDELHQDIHSNIPMSTSASEDSSNHEHNINEIKETSKQFAKLIRDAREPLYPNYVKFSKLEFLIKLLHLKTMN